MTIELEAHRRYPTAPGAAFDYITDPHNWPEYWPDLVAVHDLERARWREPGDTMRLRMRLAGRETDLTMTLREFVAGSLVTYRSVQAGLPDVEHERHWTAGDARNGFDYRLVVRYAPRPGLAGLLDRTVVRLATARALRKTLDNLEQRLGSAPGAAAPGAAGG
jgi:hypothetical protein